MSTELFKDFESHSKKQWKQLLQHDLKGAPYQDLISPTLEGIDIQPIYTKEDRSQSVQIASNVKDFGIAQRFFLSKGKGLVDQMKAALGAGSDTIILEASHDLETLLKFIEEQDLSEQLVIEVSKLNPKQIQTLCFSYKGQLNYDPIGHLERSGYLPKGFDWKDFKSLMRLYRDQIQLDLNTFIYTEAGASIAQQLSYSISKAKEYLERLDYMEGIVFHNHISLGTNFFFEIAKIVSFKELWKNFNDTLKTNYSCHISGRSSLRYFGIYDYNNNIIRSATANLAAALGGVDFIEQIPYDLHFKFKNEFSESVSRSQLLILKHETSILGKDWVAGNYYIDQLTHQFLNQSIEEIQNIEKQGGLLKELFQNNIQESIFVHHAKEFEKFREDQIAIIGVKPFRDPSQKLKGEIQRNEHFQVTNKSITPILPVRLAYALEQELLKSEDYEA